MAGSRGWARATKKTMSGFATPTGWYFSWHVTDSREGHPIYMRPRCASRIPLAPETFTTDEPVLVAGERICIKCFQIRDL